LIVWIEFGYWNKTVDFLPDFKPDFWPIYFLPANVHHLRHQLASHACVDDTQLKHMWLALTQIQGKDIRQFDNFCLGINAAWNSWVVALIAILFEIICKFNFNSEHSPVYIFFCNRGSGMFNRYMMLILNLLALSPSQFHSKLKTHLFQQSFPP
jgi:hypothetical protein